MSGQTFCSLFFLLGAYFRSNIDSFIPVFTAFYNKSLVLTSKTVRGGGSWGVVTHRGKEATNQIPLMTSQWAAIRVHTRNTEKRGEKKRKVSGEFTDACAAREHWQSDL